MHIWEKNRVLLNVSAVTDEFAVNHTDQAKQDVTGPDESVRLSISHAHFFFENNRSAMSSPSALLSPSIVNPCLKVSVVNCV